MMASATTLLHYWGVVITGRRVFFILLDQIHAEVSRSPGKKGLLRYKTIQDIGMPDRTDEIALRVDVDARRCRDGDSCRIDDSTAPV